MLPDSCPNVRDSVHRRNYVGNSMVITSLSHNNSDPNIRSSATSETAGLCGAIAQECALLGKSQIQLPVGSLSEEDVFSAVGGMELGPDVSNDIAVTASAAAALLSSFSPLADHDKARPISWRFPGIVGGATAAASGRAGFPETPAPAPCVKCESAQATIAASSSLPELTSGGADAVSAAANANTFGSSTSRSSSFPVGSLGKVGLSRGERRAREGSEDAGGGDDRDRDDGNDGDASYADVLDRSPGYISIGDVQAVQECKPERGDAEPVACGKDGGRREDDAVVVSEPHTSAASATGKEKAGKRASGYLIVAGGSTAGSSKTKNVLSYPLADPALATGCGTNPSRGASPPFSMDEGFGKGEGGDGGGGLGRHELSDCIPPASCSSGHTFPPGSSLPPLASSSPRLPPLSSAAGKLDLQPLGSDADNDASRDPRTPLPLSASFALDEVKNLKSQSQILFLLGAKESQNTSPSRDVSSPPPTHHVPQHARRSSGSDGLGFGFGGGNRRARVTANNHSFGDLDEGHKLPPTLFPSIQSEPELAAAVAAHHHPVLSLTRSATEDGSAVSEASSGLNLPPEGSLSVPSWDFSPGRPPYNALPNASTANRLHASSTNVEDDLSPSTGGGGSVGCLGKACGGGGGGGGGGHSFNLWQNLGGLSASLEATAPSQTWAAVVGSFPSNSASVSKGIPQVRSSTSVRSSESGGSLAQFTGFQDSQDPSSAASFSTSPPSSTIGPATNAPGEAPSGGGMGFPFSRSPSLWEAPQIFNLAGMGAGANKLSPQQPYGGVGRKSVSASTLEDAGSDASSSSSQRLLHSMSQLGLGGAGSAMSTAANATSRNSPSILPIGASGNNLSSSMSPGRFEGFVSSFHGPNNGSESGFRISNGLGIADAGGGQDGLGSLGSGPFGPGLVHSRQGLGPGYGDESGLSLDSSVGSSYSPFRGDGLDFGGAASGAFGRLGAVNAAGPREPINHSSNHSSNGNNIINTGGSGSCFSGDNNASGMSYMPSEYGFFPDHYPSPSSSLQSSFASSPCGSLGNGSSFSGMPMSLQSPGMSAPAGQTSPAAAAAAAAYLLTFKSFLNQASPPTGYPSSSPSDSSGFEIFGSPNVLNDVFRSFGLTPADVANLQHAANSGLLPTLARLAGGGTSPGNASISPGGSSRLFTAGLLRGHLHGHGGIGYRGFGGSGGGGGRLSRRTADPVAEVERRVQQERLYSLNTGKILAGEDRRTTLMIKNIPNKYTQKMLLATIDEHFKGLYDFFYLPIDFKNKCNVGYAFVNMINPRDILAVIERFDNKKWERFNSEKICSISYARIQGRAALVAHFQNSSLMNEDKRCRPVLFSSEGTEIMCGPTPYPPSASTHSPPPFASTYLSPFGAASMSVPGPHDFSPPALVPMASPPSTGSGHGGAGPQGFPSPISPPPIFSNSFHRNSNSLFMTGMTTGSGPGQIGGGTIPGMVGGADGRSPGLGNSGGLGISSLNSSMCEFSNGSANASVATGGGQSMSFARLFGGVL